VIYTILEARTVKRLSKKIKDHYMVLKPGEIWMNVRIEHGQRVQIMAAPENTGPLYVGRSDIKLM
jgi:hypothetical protein